MKKEEIVKRLEEKEFIKRCKAVNMCWECGRDFQNIERTGTHWVSLACMNSECNQFKIIQHTSNA